MIRIIAITLILLISEVLANDEQDIFNSRARIAEAIKKELVNQNVFDHNPTDENIKLELKFANEKLIDDSNYEVERIDIVNLHKNVASFLGKITLTKDVFDKTEVKFYGKFTELLDIPVLKKRINAGEVIEDADFETIKIPVRRITKDVLMNQKEAVGMVSKAGMAAQQMVFKKHLVSPRIIHKNDVITVCYKSESIYAQVTGVAIEEGGLGDFIKVKNANSNIIIKAVVEGDKIVRVHSL